MLDLDTELTWTLEVLGERAQTSRLIDRLIAPLHLRPSGYQPEGMMRGPSQAHTVDTKVGRPTP